MMSKWIAGTTRFLLLMIVVLLGACGGGGSGSASPAAPALSSAKAITAYALGGASGRIDETNKSIAVTLPYGTDVTALVATFSTTAARLQVGAVTQTSGTTPNDFTQPVTYTAVAADGSSAQYTVTVTVAANSAKAITAYALAGVSGVINESSKTIDLTVPNGTDVTALVATFSTTAARLKVGTVTQTSGSTANDFTRPVTYTAVAADGSSTSYTVTVTVTPSSAKAITAFSVAGVGGLITDATQTIAVTVPNNTDLTTLVASFTTTGASVKVGSTTQVSGSTVNDFTNPVTYTVTAADSSSVNYVVTVTPLAPTCSDGLKNGLETDVDCGGPTCGACADNQHCSVGSDCGSRVCVGSVCQPATCTDSVKNSLETDIDCGGGVCPACSAGRTCLLSGDCQSRVCSGNTCQGASCFDAVKNGSETDVDCGGGACAACAMGQACSVNSDCQSGVCSGNICR